MVLIAFAYFYYDAARGLNFLNNSLQKSSFLDEDSLKIVADNLNIPWAVSFLPGGEVIITERPGTLYFKNAGKRISVENVFHFGEGGLLGLAVHPDFSNNKWIYLYFTTEENNNILNKIERYKLENYGFSEKTVILEGIAGAMFHNGGRIAFGPDGFLYIATGDATKSEESQDINSLSGKILRIKDDGLIPKDNPFSNAVFAYGFRNPQGLAWDEQGRLWATDHGRSGVLSGLDELNLVEKGKNYGWPEIQGNEAKEGMVAPVINSGATKTWAPAGAAFMNGSVFFGGLRGEALFEYDISGNLLKKYFEKDFGRIREVFAGPDGFLYFTTSNRDGRGDLKNNDDKLVKIKMQSEKF